MTSDRGEAGKEVGYSDRLYHHRACKCGDQCGGIRVCKMRRESVFFYERRKS